MEPAADSYAGDEEPGFREEEPSPIPKHPGGRPKGSKTQNRTVTVTRQEFVGSGPSERDELKDDSFAPLFDSSEVSERSIVRCRVIRRDPDEGMVGYIDDPQTGDNTIAEQWGGSVYRLEGLNGGGKIVAVRTVKLAGDPIFKSAAAEHQWRRSKGLPPAAGSPHTVAAQPTMTFHEMMAFTQAAEDKRRVEEREHAKLMRQMELDAEEKKRRDEDDRRRLMRAEEEERESRRRKDDEERDTRRRREQSEAEQRQQQFMQQTIQMIQASSAQAIQFAKAGAEAAPAGGTNSLLEMVKTIAVIKDAFGGEGGGGGGEEEGTFQTLFKNLPAILNGAGGAIGSAIREVKSGGVQPSFQPASPVAGLLPAGSPLASKVEALAMKIAEKGGDPEKVLSGIADGIMATLDGKNPQVQVAVPATVNPQTVHGFKPHVEPATASRVATKSGYVSTATRISFGKKP